MQRKRKKLPRDSSFQPLGYGWRHEFVLFWRHLYTLIQRGVIYSSNTLHSSALGSSAQNLSMMSFVPLSPKP
jgi:hypothetical protein